MITVNGKNKGMTCNCIACRNAKKYLIKYNSREKNCSEYLK